MTLERLKPLEGIVGAEHLLADGEAHPYVVDGMQPSTVVFPGNVEEVSAVLAVCSKAGNAVVPWGGGVHMGLGGVPKKVDVVLGLGRLNRVLDHEPGDMTSAVQAGMPLADYQAHLSRHGQILGLDPPGGARATVGGILAANASGPRRLRYGTARDQLIGVRVVHADGTVTKGGAKVVKNVTGYDMNKLYVGSLGSLGVIVEATFRLYPLPPCERTLAAAFPKAAKAREIVARLLDSPLVPSAVELLNESAAREVLRQSDVASEPRGVLLAVAIASVPEAVEAQVRTAQGMVAGEAGDSFVLDGAVNDAFWAAVRDFTPGDVSAVVLKASVLLDKVTDAMECGERLAAQHGLQVAVISEAGTGILRFYFQADDENGATRLAQVVDPLRGFALQARGSLVVLEAPVAVKAQVDVWGPANGLALMRGLKEQFDPGGVLNPGRFVGGL
jgi:glycolate oxidase FAD binding subunit